jgi:hypothetical protein
MKWMVMGYLDARGENPSPVSAFGRSTLSHKGRGVSRCMSKPRCPLLPLWEKVSEGRMRGI